MASKINVTPKGLHLSILKLYSVLAVAILLVHNEISQICYCDQISLQSTAVKYSFSDNLIPLGVPFILWTILHALCFDIFNYLDFVPKKTICIHT